jgi:hypothetical protein
METKYKDFCEKYKERKDITEKSDKQSLKNLNSKKEDVVFNLVISKSGSMIEDISLELDDEDLDHIYSQFSKKLEEEMNKNIEDIKDSYLELF